MTRYALIQKAEPVVVTISGGEIGISGSTTTNEHETATATTKTDQYSPSSSSVTSQQLLSLYETYSEIYPNPALQEENYERDRLLRAISAANHAVQVNPKKKEPNKKSQRWWNLFGRGSNSGQEENNSTTTRTIEDENDDDRLVYNDNFNDGDQYDRDLLLGTEFSIDRTCIPNEVHSLARQYLCMNRKTDTKKYSSPNIARISWETAGTSCIVIAGLGRLVEFRKRTKGDSIMKPVTTDSSGDTEYKSSGKEVYTSDRQQLLDYYFMRRQREQHNGRKALSMMTHWHPSHAHAALVGPNFLIIHWGLDSSVILYRRVAIPSDDIIVDDSHCTVTWEAVAICGAMAQVRESLADVFSEDDGDTELLNVTAVHPLVVEIPQHAPIVTLAVARLGGFIELVPLPPQMWYGPEIPFAKKHIQPWHTTQGTKRRKGVGPKSGHSTAGYNLPDLAIISNIGGGIVVLNTVDYHTDLLGLESFPITHKRNEAWNKDLYPDGPPAEYILAAYGTKAQMERNVVSFWSFSTKVAPSAPGGVGFTICSTVIEAVDLGNSGPDISLVASPTIYRHWRKQRNVKLRDSNSVHATDTRESKNHCATTISVSVPIIQISFALLDDNQKEVGPGNTVFAAVLDWNGGVTLLDCSLLARTAAHTLTDDEYEQLFRKENQDEVIPLVNTMANRTRVARSIYQYVKSDSAPICVSAIKCFQNPCIDSIDLLVAAVTSDTLFFIFAARNNSSGDSLLLKTTAIPCLKLGRGQFLSSSTRHFMMNLIFQAHQSIEPRQSDSACVAMNFCGVLEQKPYDIIKSLLNSKKFKEALITAEKFPQYELSGVTSILEDCKKELWRAEYNVSVLESIRDDEYIVNVALPPLIKSEEQFSYRIFLNDDVALYITVCRLALKRIHTAQLSLSLSFSDKSIEIKSRLISLGTYILLCEDQEVKPSLFHFFKDFIRIPMTDLAMSCAKRADIVTLSILWFRHRHELSPHHFRFLNGIPVSVCPTLYQHLLPVLQDGELDKKLQGSFVAGCEVLDICAYLDFPDYLDQLYRRAVVVDDEDTSLVLEQGLKYFATADPSGERYNTDDLADWYTIRALAIEKFVTSFVSVISFARLALTALRIPESDVMDQTFISSSPSVQYLQHLIRFSELQRTIPFGDKDLTYLGLKTFEDMDKIDIVTLTFKCGGESVDYLARYKDCLLPLMTRKLDGYEELEINSAIDEAIQKFCLDLFRDDAHHDIVSFLDNVTVCSTIIHSCRTNIALSSRIVKQRESLICFSETIVEKIVKICSLLTLRPKDQQNIVAALWKIYESLPVSLPNRNSNDVLTATLGSLYQSLTFLEIVTCWPNTDAFVKLQQYTKFTTKNSSAGVVEFLSIGKDTVSLLCQLFCRQVEESRNNSTLYRKSVALLSALINDCNELNQICFQGQLQLPSLFIDHLAKPLIAQHDVALFGEYLSQSVHNTVERRTISNEVLLSFNEAAYGAAAGKHRERKIKAAIDFQQVLGKWLPELRDEFASIRHFLDAAHFIATTLLPESIEILKPEQIQSMKALDVICYILTENPKAIVIDQLEWEDPVWSKQANEVIRRNINFTINDPEILGIQVAVPKLPGVAIFHLAQLLGLTDITSVVAVKSLAVDFALVSKLSGAAAAICRSLMADSSTSDVGINLALTSVAKLVSRVDFDDYLTRQELCTSALLHISTRIQGQSLESFEIILRSWNRLQNSAVVYDRDTDYPSATFRRLFADSRRQYGADIADLLFSLFLEASSNVIDDEAITALARYAAFWCIDQTTTAKIVPCPQFQSQAVNVIVEFTAALVLHVKDRTLFREWLKELNVIFSGGRNDSSMLSATRSTLTNTNPEIVNSLIGRGYSENGARRSADAVNNISFRDALQWAVTHSTDAGFDDPIIILRSTDQAQVDPEIAESLQHFFTCIESVYEASARSTTSVEKVDIVLEQDKTTMTAAITIPVKLSSHENSKAEGVIEARKADSLMNDIGTDHALERAKPIPVLMKMELEQVNQSGSVQANSNVESDLPIENTTQRTSRRLPVIIGERNITSNVNETASLISKFTKRNSPVSAPAVFSSRERTGIAITIPKSNESSPDRSTLFQVGQEAFLNAQQHRRPSSSPSRAERLRLIEEGRRLLNQARSTLSVPSDQHRLSTRSASTTPTSVSTNPIAQPAMGSPSPVTNGSSSLLKISDCPPDNVKDTSNSPDEWDFDDENFDL